MQPSQEHIRAPIAVSPSEVSLGAKHRTEYLLDRVDMVAKRALCSPAELPSLIRSELRREYETVFGSPEIFRTLSKWFKPFLVARVIDRESFSRIYDPNLPTIGIELPCGFDGALLIAFAAQRLRLAGSPSVNVVYLPPLWSGALKLASGGAGNAIPFVDAGAMVDADGIWFADMFPSPVRIDAIANFRRGAEFTKLAERSGLRFINGSQVIASCSDKVATKFVLEGVNVKTPAFMYFRKEGDLIESAFSDASGSTRVSARQTLERGVTAFVHRVGTEGGFVVKPSAESGGRGVVMLDRGSTIEDVAAAVRATCTKYGEALLEVRIRSYPLYDRDGARLDWNFRVLASGAQMPDIEARVGPWGRPVNKYLGAKIWEAHDLVDRLAPRADGRKVSYAEVQGKILDVCKKIAIALPGGFLGHDAVFDENLDVWIFEVNSGHVGGLGSLAEIRTTPEDKLKAASAFARALADDFGERRSPVNFSGLEERVPEFETAAFRLARIRHTMTRLGGDLGKDAPERGYSWREWLEDASLVIAETNRSEPLRLLADIIQLIQCYRAIGSHDLALELATSFPGESSLLLAPVIISCQLSLGRFDAALQAFSDLVASPSFAQVGNLLTLDDGRQLRSAASERGLTSLVEVADTIIESRAQLQDKHEETIRRWTSEAKDFFFGPTDDNVSARPRNPGQRSNVQRRLKGAAS